MSFLGLLNQTASLYRTTGFDAYGRETVGSATTIDCRMQKTTKRKLLENGAWP